jgi:thiamine-monophosphate kinase
VEIALRYNLETEIDWLKNRLTPRLFPGLLTKIGEDDCAHFYEKNKVVVVTSDFINANPLITRLGLGGPRELGRLLAANNISDLLGSGAEPKYLLLNVCIPGNWGKSEFRSIITGAQEIAKKAGVVIIGGDSKYGKSLSLCGTAIGTSSSKGSRFLKSSATKNQDILISNQVGACTAAAIAATRPSLRRKYKRWITRVICSPSLPFKQAQAARGIGVRSGGIDVSDGLGADINEMCRSSGVGALIDEAKIPIGRTTRKLAKALKVDPIRLAFGIGGDFAFIITADAEHLERLTSFGFRKIGETTASLAVKMRKIDGEIQVVESKGHNDALFDDIVTEAATFAGVKS